MFACFSSYCQVEEKKIEDELKPFPLKEVYVSINRTAPSSEEAIEPEIGFGIGARGYLMKTSFINLAIGLEYNRTAVFIRDYGGTHFSSTKDARINLNGVSVPFNMQFSFGSKTKFIVELGQYIELIVNGSGKATTSTYLPNTTPTNGEQNVKIGTSIFLGPSFGIGLKRQLELKTLILRVDYKYGLLSSSSMEKNSIVRIVGGIEF
jgi:hypothetical protein